jgi:cell shape-determining protein MreC
MEKIDTNCIKIKIGGKEYDFPTLYDNGKIDTLSLNDDINNKNNILQKLSEKDIEQSEQIKNTLEKLKKEYNEYEKRKDEIIDIDEENKKTKGKIQYAR